MTKKRVSFKPASEIREIEKNIDKWVQTDIKKEEVPYFKKEIPPELELYRFTIDIPKYLHRRIKKMCASEDISMRDKLTEVLLEAFPEK